MARKPDDEALRQIFQQLAGPMPRLYMPVDSGTRRQKVGTRFVVAPGWRDLTGTAADAESVWAHLKGIPIPAALHIVALVDLILSRRSFHDPLHATFCRGLLSEERLIQLKRFLGAEVPHPDDYNVFTRAGMLLLMRLMLAVSTEDSEEPVALHALGDLMLMVNEHALGSRSQETGRLKDADCLELAVEMLPLWEINNPPDLAYGLSRASRMFEILIKATDPAIQRIRARLPIDFSTLTFDGLTLEDYTGCVFAIHAWLESLDVRKLLVGEANLVVDTSNLLSQVGFPRHLLEVFVAARSLAIAEFKTMATPIAGPEDLRDRLASDAFLSDLVLLRNFPICRLGGTRVFCLDAPFLVELLVYGLYWRILDRLSGNRSDGNAFTDLWGRAFELYLFEMITFHSLGSELSPWKTDILCEGGQIDAALDLGKDVVIFEFKGSLLKAEAKNNRDPAKFAEDFSLKFIENQKGAPKALRQLASACDAAAHGILKLAAIPRRIYPVVVGYEPALESFCVNAYADDEFQKLLDPSLKGCVRPLSLMSVETFEATISYTSAGDISWPELLERRFDGDNKVFYYSVYQALYDWRVASNREVRRNEFVVEGLHRAMDSVLKRFRDHQRAKGEEDHPLIVEQPSKNEIMISPTEVRGMVNRFGSKTLQMGHLQEDGSMMVPMDCVVEAVRSPEASASAGRAETLRKEQVVSLLESDEALVARVGEARKKRLERMVEDFQSEPRDAKAREQWKEIEKTIFGVEYQD